MQGVGPERRTRRSNSRGRSILGKLDEVILGDLMGEAGWMLLLVIAVLAVLGLVWLFALGA